LVIGLFLFLAPAADAGLNQVMSEQTYWTGVNVTDLRALSNNTENIEKMFFLPKMNGVFSLGANAQVTATGSSIIFTVNFPSLASNDSPPTPRNLMIAQSSRSNGRSFATAAGMMEQSAPVSTRKSKFWYPALVKTGILMIGSRVTPKELLLSPYGNSPGINEKGILRWDVSNGEQSSGQFFSSDLAGQFAVRAGACEHVRAFAGDESAAEPALEFQIRDFWFHGERSLAQGSMPVKGQI
jgi:hypothetical protein